MQSQWRLRTGGNFAAISSRRSGWRIARYDVNTRTVMRSKFFWSFGNMNLPGRWTCPSLRREWSLCTALHTGMRNVIGTKFNCWKMMQSKCKWCFTENHIMQVAWSFHSDISMRQPPEKAASSDIRTLHDKAVYDYSPTLWWIILSIHCLKNHWTKSATLIMSVTLYNLTWPFRKNNWRPVVFGFMWRV